MDNEALVKGVIGWMDVLRARAEAGDSRAVEALRRHPLLTSDWVEESRREAARMPSITAWVVTWPLDPAHERGEGEDVYAWVLRQCRLMGMNTMEAAGWLREVRS